MIHLKKTTHQSCVFVNQVEDGVEFRNPLKAVRDTFPPQLACHNLKQVHLDGLLNEHNKVLCHGYRIGMVELASASNSIAVFFFVCLSLYDYLSIVHFGH